MPTILIKKSDTPGSVPGTANLTNLAGGAEVAVNTADRRMFTMNSSSAVVELGTNPSSLTCADGSFTLLKAASASITNLTATSLVLSNLSIASANVTTLTSASATITNLLATSLTVSGNTFLATSSGNVGIGTSSPLRKLSVAGDMQSYNTAADGASNTVIGRWTSQVRNYGANIGTASFASIEFATGTWPTGNIRFLTNGTDGTDGAGTERMRLDSSGNLGLGVTPSAWRVSSGSPLIQAIQIGNNGSYLSAGTTGLSSDCYYWTGNNGYNNSSGNWIYSVSKPAAQYGMFNGEHRWYIAPSGTAGNTISFTQAMTLTAGGLLGVGTTSPQDFASNRKTLEVASGQGAYILASDTTNSAYCQIAAEASVGYMGMRTNHPVAFVTNNTERARINSDGDILFGTSTVFNSSTFTFDAGADRGIGILSSVGGAHLLQVRSTNANYADLGGGMVYIENNGGATETGYRAISVYSNAGARFAVRGDGTIYSTNTAVQAISDARFKENIRPLECGLAEILKVKPRRFDWKEGKGTGKKNIAGFVAQEIETIFPDLVDEFKDGIEDETMYKSVGYAGLIPTLVKSIQEQQAMIEELKAKVAALEAK